MTDAEFQVLKLKRIREIYKLQRRIAEKQVTLDEDVQFRVDMENCLNCSGLVEDHPGGKCLWQPTYYLGEALRYVWILDETYSYRTLLFQSQLDAIRY